MDKFADLKEAGDEEDWCSMQTHLQVELRRKMTRKSDQGSIKKRARGKMALPE